MRNPLKLLGKAIFYIGGTLVGLTLLLYISGNSHVITAVKKSILIGQFGPKTTDLELFPKRTIAESRAPFEWSSYNYKTELLPSEEEVHNNLESSSMLVIYKDSILFEKYWEGNTLLTYTNSFSVAKSIVGTLCAIAASEGKVKFEDPISIYLPELRNRALGELTFAQLLSMSAATDWTESGANPFSDNARAYYGDDLVKLIESTEVDGKPGQVFNYQSGNTALAGHALSKALNKTLSEYAAEKLWSKIGGKYPAYWSLDKEDGLEKAYCCYYAVTRDFAKLGRLWLNNGMWDSTEVVNPSYFDLLTRPYVKDFGPCPEQCYGISFWLENYGGHDFYYARGILGQYIIMMPEQDLIIVRTGGKRMEKNERHHPTDLYAYIDQALRLKQEHEERY